MTDKPKRASEYESEQAGFVRATCLYVATKLAPLLDEPEAKKALKVLRRDFMDPDSVGPRRVAEFITGGPDDDLQADVVGYVVRLLGCCD